MPSLERWRMVHRRLVTCFNMDLFLISSIRLTCYPGRLGLPSRLLANVVLVIPSILWQRMPTNISSANRSRDMCTLDRMLLVVHTKYVLGPFLSKSDSFKSTWYHSLGLVPRSSVVSFSTSHHGSPSTNFGTFLMSSTTPPLRSSIRRNGFLRTATRQWQVRSAKEKIS